MSYKESFFVVRKPDGWQPTYEGGWHPWDARRFLLASNAAFEAERLSRERGARFRVCEVRLEERTLDDNETRLLMREALSDV